MKATRRSRSGLLRLAIAALAAGCQAPPGDAPADTSYSPPPGALCLPDGQDPESACCETGQRFVSTEVRTVIDLSDVDTIAQGTCGTYLHDESPRRRGFELPNAPDAYPLKLILPGGPGQDPRCESLCNEFEPYTAFGIALQTEGLIGGNTGRGLSVLVPAPWKFVSGGSGEASPYPCLGGYQEFGIRSCITFFHGDFGVATADPEAPSVEVLVELIEVPTEPLAPGHCCPYLASP